MTDDEIYMRRALALARLQNGRTGKNPAVGCIILNAEGRVISEAATGDSGRPHAEQLALSRLQPGQAAGGTAYVTLEPCIERSTGEASCSTQLIDADLARVVVAALDPHPQGAGGVKRLQDAGLIVDAGLMEAEAEALYEVFFSSIS
ncbi:MAG: bifunctional diaminohydroxyphosphoribosylaminopyrimidine deaminase/5-amino-6-(5-phosphoribosylamino)uracil reductase RibD [Pseudomonadota bacterium]